MEIVDAHNTNGIEIGQDGLYAKEAVKSIHPNLKHSIVKLTPAELVKTYSPPVIQKLQLWGYMETRNSLIISAALDEAQKLGLTDVIVGDNADEIFGGSYDIMMDDKFATDIESWKIKRDGMADLPFVTEKLGTIYNINVHQPFRDKALFVDWAVSETSRNDCIDNECSIQSKLGGPWEVQNCGKIPLREAFCTVASWRRMDWIFRGSSAQEGKVLIEYYNTVIADEEFQTEKEKYKNEGVVLKSKEHLHTSISKSTVR